MPWRRIPSSAHGALEVYLVRRAANLATLGGFWAFAGGAIDAADEALTQTHPERALMLSGLRELFEETGLLPAGARGSLWPHLRRHEARRALLAAGTDNKEVLLDLGLDAWVKDHSLCPLGRWLTPPFGSGRFDAHYFALQCDDQAAQHAAIWPGELQGGRWISPQDALLAHESRKDFLAQPVRHTLWHLSRTSGAPQDRVDALSRVLSQEAPETRTALTFFDGITLVPQKTPTLLPHTHTNCYVVGKQKLAVIDPGADDPEEQHKLAQYLRQQKSAGKHVALILLTHEHPDHIGGAGRLKEEFNAPILAHQKTAERIKDTVSVDVLVEDGAVIDLGPMRWQALFTPGHAQGHLCLYELGTHHLIAGDNVLGFGTSIVVPPPNGDMQAYMASLERLLSLELGMLFPGHGPPSATAHKRISDTLNQRRQRERLIFDASAVLAGRGERATLAALVSHVYRGLGASLRGMAELNLLAHLVKLEHEGRLVRLFDDKGLPEFWTHPGP